MKKIEYIYIEAAYLIEYVYLKLFKEIENFSLYCSFKNILDKIVISMI